METNADTYQSRGLLIATSVTYEKPRIENITKFTGRGVSYCVACDGAFYKNLQVGVIGSKNYAAKEALELLDHTHDVTLYTNGKSVKMDQRFKSEVEEHNIPINKEKIHKLVGDRSVDGLILQNGERIDLDGVFVAIGDLGATNTARALGLQIEEEFIEVDEYGQTNMEHVYAAGDCTGVNLQIAIAVGEGGNATLNLLADLEGRPKGQLKDY